MSSGNEPICMREKVIYVYMYIQHDIYRQYNIDVYIYVYYMCVYSI